MKSNALSSILRSASVFAVALAALGLTTGCVGGLSGSGSASSKRGAQMALENPPVVHPIETSQVAPPHNEGSLFNPASNAWSPWSEVTAQAVGDIVTVRVTITTNAEGTATTDVSRDSSIDAGIQSLFGKETSLPGVAAAATSTNPANGTSPAHLIQANATSSFKGAGDTKRTGSIVADVSCVVTQVSANGNLAIHGSQSTLINAENSILTVDGTVRRTDISSDNVVTSDRIANSRIEITGRGIISDKQKPGTWMRAFDWLWPF